MIAPDVTTITAPPRHIAYSNQRVSQAVGLRGGCIFRDEQERVMRNQETTIVLDSVSSQSKAETTNTHIELSEEELDKITGGGGPPTIVRD
jgi:bacteriocin-like protein